jgi:hypothetical protein
MNRRTKRLRLAAATGFCSAGSANFEYQFGMEARVGIGPFCAQFRDKMALPWQVLKQFQGF